MNTACDIMSIPIVYSSQHAGEPYVRLINMILHTVFTISEFRNRCETISRQDRRVEYKDYLF